MKLATEDMAAVNWRTTLDVPLFSPTTLLSIEVRQHLVIQLWPSAQVFTGRMEDFDAFFEYYAGTHIIYNVSKAEFEFGRRGES